MYQAIRASVWLVLVLSTDLSAVVTGQEGRCQLPLVKGPCRAFIPSYYYNSASGQCENFVYGGCGGNDNRFSSETACREACIDRPSDPFLSSNKDCNLPQVTGLCRAFIPSFSYNTQTGQCQRFIYGGCAGNANRFKTEIACQEACLSDSRPSAPLLSSNKDCNLPQVTGPCRAFIPSFSYNTQTGQCQRFIYGGCGGNANRFQSEDECEQKCSSNADSVCYEPKTTGNCRAYMLRWYFNSDEGRCLWFVYGGCGANGNNFRSLGECQQRCNPHSEESGSNESQEHY